MPCWKPSILNECVSKDGEVFYRFKPSPRDHVVKSFPVGCKQCSGCRTKSVRNHGIRSYHESLSFEHNCFITLTVNPESSEFVFPGGSVRYVEFQKFMRRLRKAVKNRVRFTMCAEYGPQFDRPHFHAILFGFCPMSQYPGDTRIIKRCPTGNLYSSRILTELWSFGYSSVGFFDIGCANYVAGYIRKKINGRLKNAWYQGHTQEFAKSSLKPGIGFNFYKKYTSDMYRKDKVTLPGGSQVPIPTYYDVKHEFYHPGHMAKVKATRALPNPVRDKFNDPERLAARKVITEQRLRSQRRSYESEE